MDLLITGKNLVNGSPVNPLRQEQIGLWFMTKQFEFWPQGFGQRSAHLWLTQAILVGHSELTTHSGRQDGGLPEKFGRHEHTACSETTLHWLFGPQGDGLHTSLGGVAV